MAEGRESVLYALPFCAGTVTGIFICSHFTVRSGSMYWLAACTLAGCLLSAWMLLSSKVGKVPGGCAKYAAAIAAVFLCGMFCWTSGSLSKLSCPDAVAGGGHAGPAASLTAPAAAWLKDGIDSLPLGSPADNALIKALVTGDQSDVPASVKAAFRDSGASHILALSGMHLALIYVILTRMLSVFGKSREADIARFAVIIASTLFYSVMTGSSPSIVRAFIFISLRETAILCGRKPSDADILCFSLTLQCALDPEVITSAGFQLSYLAMCGIYFLYPHLRDMYPAKVPVLKTIWNSAALSIACQVFTGPLAWLLFGSAPMYFIITNLIAVPMTSALMPAALAAVFLHEAGICPEFLTEAIGWTAGAVVDCLEVICELP